MSILSLTFMKRIYPKLQIFGGLVLLLGGSLASCDRLPERDTQEIFRYNESAGISSLDPAFARNQANIWATHQIFSGLVQMDGDLEIRPAIAQNWSIQDSGRSYRFKLREDVLFHKDPCFSSSAARIVTARDFVYSFDRLQSAELAAPGAWVLQNVKSYRAVDSFTLEINLYESFPPFLGLLSMQYCSVVPKEAIEFYEGDYRRHPIGTGPFHFQMWEENERLILRRNPDYFETDSLGHPLPYLEAVAISFIPDKQSAFLEFVKGNLDLISGIDASYKDELLTRQGALREKYRDRFILYKQAYLNTEYLGFQMDSSARVTQNSPLLKKEVRQAINYSFDRKKMMRYLRNNIGTPAKAGFIPRGLPAYNPTQVKGYHYDPERARQLLKEAGYPEGEGLAPITLQTNSSYRDICEYIQSEARKVGIPLQVEVTPPSTLRQSMATGKVAFFRGSWIADYPDAENYLSLFYSPNAAPEGPNYTRFSSARYDSLYRRARTLSDPQARRRLYREMDSIILEEAPVVPLYYDQVLRFYPRHVHDLAGNAMNLLDLKGVWKSRPPESFRK